MVSKQRWTALFPSTAAAASTPWSNSGKTGAIYTTTKKPESGGGQRHLKPQRLQPLGQSFRSSGRIVPVEVVDTEVVVGHLVPQYEVHGREQRRRNGDNRLLGTALGLQTLKLRMGVEVAAPNGRPGCLYQHRFHPRRAVSDPCGAALARTLIKAWTKTHPRSQVTRRRESSDVHADFSDDRLRDEHADAGNGRETLHHLAQRSEEDLEAGVDGPQPFLDRFHLRQVQTQQKAVVLSDLAVKSRLKLIRIGAQQTCGTGEQSVGTRLHLNQTANDGAPAHPEEVADEAGNLQIGVLERLLQPQAMLRDLPPELLPRPREVPELLDRGGWDEAPPNESMRHQVGEPGGIVHIALAPWDRAHVPGIGQHQGELRLENVPDRLPIHAGGFEGDDLALVCTQPLGQRQQPPHGRGKPCTRPNDLPPGHRPCARNDFVLVYVETGASLMDDVHSPPPDGAARSWRIYSLQSVLRCRPPGRHVDTVCGAAPAPGPT